MTPIAKLVFFVIGLAPDFRLRAFDVRFEAAYHTFLQKAAY